MARNGYPYPEASTAAPNVERGKLNFHPQQGCRSGAAPWKGAPTFRLSVGVKIIVKIEAL